MNGFLLDTNVLSELIRPKPERKVVEWIASADEDFLFISVLTLGEIRKGIAMLPGGSRRARLEAWFESDLRARFSGRILAIDEDVADRWGQIAAAAAAAGQPLPVIDALLAASALHHNLTLVTRDDSAVAGTGVLTLNPWT